MATSILAQQKTIGEFSDQTDVGNPIRTGGASYSSELQEYKISGAGTNMWADRDEFHFVWRRMKGNFIATSTAAFVGKGVEQHRKIGWMVRSSLNPGSQQASVVLQRWLDVITVSTRSRGANPGKAIRSARR